MLSFKRDDFPLHGHWGGHPCHLAECPKAKSLASRKGKGVGTPMIQRMSNKGGGGLAGVFCLTVCASLLLLIRSSRTAHHTPVQCSHHYWMTISTFLSANCDFKDQRPPNSVVNIIGQKWLQNIGKHEINWGYLTQLWEILLWRGGAWNKSWSVDNKKKRRMRKQELLAFIVVALLPTIQVSTHSLLH